MQTVTVLTLGWPAEILACAYYMHDHMICIKNNNLITTTKSNFAEHILTYKHPFTKEDKVEILHRTDNWKKTIFCGNTFIKTR